MGDKEKLCAMKPRLRLKKTLASGGAQNLGPLDQQASASSTELPGSDRLGREKLILRKLHTTD